MEERRFVFGDYVLNGEENVFNTKVSFWLSKKGVMISTYCFSVAADFPEKEVAYQIKGIQSYIENFEMTLRRLGGVTQEDFIRAEYVRTYAYYDGEDDDWNEIEFTHHCLISASTLEVFAREPLNQEDDDTINTLHARWDNDFVVLPNGEKKRVYPKGFFPEGTDLVENGDYWYED